MVSVENGASVMKREVKLKRQLYYSFGCYSNFYVFFVEQATSSERMGPFRAIRS